MTDRAGDALTPVEQSLVRALTRAIVRELQAESENKRPEHLGGVAGRDVHDGDDRERAESIRPPE